MKKFLIAAVVALTLLVPTATAAAHGTVSTGGDTWDDNSDFFNGYVYGLGSATATYNHASAYIKVTLQRYANGAWVNMATGEKTLSSTNTISKQVVYHCGGGAYTYTYRVMVFYKFTKDGVVHQGTTYRGQEPQDACP